MSGDLSRYKLRARLPLGALVFLFLFSLYALTMTGKIRFGDEGERYLTAQSLVDRRDLAIRVQPDLHRKIGADGRNYSSYELGSVLPLVPFYAVAKLFSGLSDFPDATRVRMLITGLSNPAITAFTAVILFELCLALGDSVAVALLISVSFGLGTFAWAYSKAFEREPILALCLVLSIFGFLRFRQTHRLGWLFLAGTSVGFEVFAKVANVILVPVFALYLALVVWEDDAAFSPAHQVWHLFWFGVPIALFGAVLAVCNQLRFGSPFEFGLTGLWGNPLSYFGLAVLPAGLAGLLFSPSKSLFLYAPPILLFFPAWVLFFRRHRLEALLLAALLVVSILFNAMNANWEQFTWWGPKYLLPIVPLFLVPVGALFSTTNAGRRQRWLLLASAALIAGLAIQLAGALVDDREYFDITGQGIDWRGAIDLLRHGAITSLVLHLAPADQPLGINPYGVVLLLFALGAGFTLLSGIRQPGSRYTGRVLGGALVLGPALLAEFVSLLVWIVIPYSGVLADQGDTRYTAGNLFLADGRASQASAMYSTALALGTRYHDEAATHLEELSGRVRGDAFSPYDLMHQVQAPEDAIVTADRSVVLTGGASLKLGVPGDKDTTVSAASNWIPVMPGATYQVSGWLKTENIYGSGYGVVSLYEDDGVWQNPRKEDVTLMDETGGWRLFTKRIAAQPTTRRFLISVGLWNTYGTLWLDDLQLARVSNP